MSDRTFAAAMFHDCPAHRVKRVLELLEKHEFTDFFALVAADFGNNGDERECLLLNRVYGGTDVHRGTAEKLANALVDEVPEVAFTVHEEPSHPEDGRVHIYTPVLNRFDANCSFDGEPTFTRQYMLDLEGEKPEIRLDRMGVPWLRAVQRMGTAPGFVEEPDRLVCVWTRGTGQVTVVGGNANGTDVDFEVGPTDEDVELALVERGFHRASPWEEEQGSTDPCSADVYRMP